MKKNALVVLTLLCFLINITPVKAACSLEEENNLSRLAANVKVNYDIAEEEIPLPEGYSTPDGLTEEEIANYKMRVYAITISISNLTEELSVEVEEDGETTKYNYSDTENGLLTIKNYETYETNNYTITIYSSSSTPCPSTKLTTRYLTTPKYNVYSTYSVCSEIPEYYLCQKFTTVDLPNEMEFLEKANIQLSSKRKEEESKEEQKEENVSSFIKENKIYFIIGGIVILVAIGITTSVIIIRNKRRN